MLLLFLNVSRHSCSVSVSFHITNHLLLFRNICLWSNPVEWFSAFSFGVFKLVQLKSLKRNSLCWVCEINLINTITTKYTTFIILTIPIRKWSTFLFTFNFQTLFAVFANKWNQTKNNFFFIIMFQKIKLIFIEGFYNFIFMKNNFFRWNNFVFSWFAVKCAYRQPTPSSILRKNQLFLTGSVRICTNVNRLCETTKHFSFQSVSKWWNKHLKY